jgi:hypothetical protein
MNETKISEMFVDAFGVDYKTMAINSFVDVSEKDIKILSYNKFSNVNEYMRINKIIRKEDSLAYIITQGVNTFKCSANHRLAIKFDLTSVDFTFIEVCDLYKIKNKYYSLNSNNNWEEISIIKTKEKIPILDIEVDNTHCYYTNNILSHNSYGNPEDTQGGNALKFWSSIRAEVRRGDVIGDKEDPTGFVTKIKLVKNKVGPPFRRIETELFIGPEKYGIDTVAEIVDLAVVNGIIRKAGAWFSYNDERWQGRESVVNAVKSNETFYNEIYTIVSKTVLKQDAPVVGSFQDILNTSTTEQIITSDEPKKRGRKPKQVESMPSEGDVHEENEQKEE